MKIEIFEPSLCCPTGVCGPEPDISLIELQNTMNVLNKAKVEVKRYAINQVPLAFTGNPVVREFITTKGPGKLPLTLLDDKIIKIGSYPSMDELSTYIPDLEGLRPDEKIIGIFG